MKEDQYTCILERLATIEQYMKDRNGTIDRMHTRVEQVEKNSQTRFRTMMTTLITVSLALAGIIFYSR